MEKIAVYISAYNAGDTLTATIESVLKQTYRNFNICIVDNGSEDNTFDIIQEYCQKYEFIYGYRRRKNFTGSFMSMIYDLMRKSDYDHTIYYKYDEWGKEIPVFRTWEEWFVIIDSDDTVQPTYLEDMYIFAKKQNLDMVTCGWDFVRPNKIDHRVPEKDEVIYRKEFASRLSYYDKFMGPVWNKLFRLDSIVQDISYYENKFSKLFKDGVYFYGADTAFNYMYLGNKLEKFGIISKSLYNYKILDKSVTRKNFHPMRIVADRRMAEVRFDFLQEIGEEITEENKKFIMNIYFKSMSTTMDLLLHDERYALEQRMEYLHEMFDNDLIREAFLKQEKRYL